MNDYYVNTNAQANGDHEVHKEGCKYMPNSRKHLGEFANCYDAVRAATRHYAQVNGCYYCSSECHTQ